MSTCVIIAGQVRSFEKTWKNQFWQVFRKLDDPHFFASVANDEDAQSLDLIKERFPGKVHWEAIDQPELPEPPKETMYHSGYPASTTAQGILKQLWHFNEAWEYFIRHRRDVEFTEVLRIRTDLWFHNFQLPPAAFSDGRNARVGFAECLTPWWSRWSGINDRVAYMGMSAAQAYFTTYTRIGELLELGCPLHPESLMAASLEQQKIASRTTLQAWFTTLRKDGKTIAPDPLIVDIADFMASL